MNKNADIITDIKAGDIFVSRNNHYCPWLIVGNGQAIQFMGLNGLLSFSPEQKTHWNKQDAIDLLNKKNFHFVTNINGKIIQSLDKAKELMFNKWEKEKKEKDIKGVNNIIKKMAEQMPDVEPDNNNNNNNNNNKKINISDGYKELNLEDIISSDCQYVFNYHWHNYNWAKNWAKVSNSIGMSYKAAKGKWKYVIIIAPIK